MLNAGAVIGRGESDIRGVGVVDKPDAEMEFLVGVAAGVPACLCRSLRLTFCENRLLRLKGLQFGQFHGGRCAHAPLFEIPLPRERTVAQSRLLPGGGEFVARQRQAAFGFVDFRNGVGEVSGTPVEGKLCLGGIDLCQKLARAYPLAIFQCLGHVDERSAGTHPDFKRPIAFDFPIGTQNRGFSAQPGCHHIDGKGTFPPRRFVHGGRGTV